MASPRISIVLNWITANAYYDGTWAIASRVQCLAPSCRVMLPSGDGKAGCLGREPHRQECSQKIRIDDTPPQALRPRSISASDLSGGTAAVGTA
jgi:hypothetical protein